MTLEHLPLLVELDSDPEVLRYLLGRARSAEEAREFWSPACADTEADAHGLGWWVGFLGDDFVGWWDLVPPSLGSPASTPATRAEAGWRLRRRHWRRGLASEGAMALFEHGFEVVGLDLIWAETMAVNEGSRGVMRRLGMQHVRTEQRPADASIPGAEHGEVIYEITRTQWQARAH